MPESRTPLHVLLDARMAEWSGVGRYTKGLARALAVRDHVALTLLAAPGGFGTDGSLPSVKTVTASSSPLSLRGMRDFTAALRAGDFDVAHSPHYPTPTRWVCPLLVTVHDVTPLVVPSVMPSALRRAVYRVLMRRATKMADQIVVDSLCTKDDVERLFPASVGKTRLTMLAADDFSEGPVGEIPAGLVAEGQRYILTMGNTKAHKDLPTLISAFNEVGAHRKDLLLLLAGAGDDAYLDALASDAVRDRVRFTGRVDDAQLRALYAGAAVFAFPSRYEGFGLPPLEAMSLGTPAVVARAASVPEVTGDAALLVEPGDVAGFSAAIGQVLDDPATAARLVAAGRQRAAELTWDATADATVEAYHAAIRAARS